MRKTKTGVAKRLIFSLCVLGALGGCAVYPAAPGYSYYDGYGYGYVAPGPAYVAPPLYFGLGIWGGGHYRHYYRGYRGYHGYRGGGGGGHWHR